QARPSPVAPRLHRTCPANHVSLRREPLLPRDHRGVRRPSVRAGEGSAAVRGREGGRAHAAARRLVAMEQAYARQYAELYRRHWWWRAREHLIVDVLTQLRPRVRWGTILDVGCGDGLFFDRAAQFGEVEGVEPDASLVSPESPYRARIHIGPFDESFEPRKRYSLVLMLDVLEHLADPAAALRHAASLLAPDGILLVTVPAFNLVWTNHDELNRHLTRYTRATLRRLADAVGLRVTHMWYFFHSLFLAKLAVRLWEAVLPRSPA